MITGKSMYSVKKVWPLGANTTRELTRNLANLGKEHWQALFRMCGYL